jgi:hypothetical protein
MIQLTAELQYDKTKPFTEQTDEVQAHINEQMKAESEKTPNTYCGRIESEKWNKVTYEIVRTYNYLANETAKNCFALKNTVITINTL